MNIINPVTFIDKLIKRNELAQPFRLTDHQRKILRLAFAFDDDGRLPWNTILYSCIKKSDKTTLNGALNSGLGIHSRAAERNPDLGQRPRANPRTCAQDHGRHHHA